MENKQPDPNALKSAAIVSPTTNKTKPRRLDVQLPYLTTPGSVKTALDRIRQAATPERVTTDFVSTILQMKGGGGGAIAPFLKKIGLVASDGSPTDLYRLFRNTATGGSAIASAIRYGYSALGNANEYFYRLSDKDLQSLIVQITGSEPSSSSAKQIFATLKALKAFADFDIASKHNEGVVVQSSGPEPRQTTPQSDPAASVNSGFGLNLAYTINLNLPATSDQSVFNAIFKSLKEHLLSND